MNENDTIPFSVTSAVPWTNSEYADPVGDIKSSMDYVRGRVRSNNKVDQIRMGRDTLSLFVNADKCKKLAGKEFLDTEETPQGKAVIILLAGDINLDQIRIDDDIPQNECHLAISTNGLVVVKMTIV